MTREGYASILLRAEVKAKIEELAKSLNMKVCPFVSEILSKYIEEHKG